MATGKELKRLRLKARLSAEKAAELMGVNADRLRKWEQKDFDPRGDDAKKIEDYFGVELEKLNTLENFDFVPNNSESASNKSIRKPKIETDPDKEGLIFVPIAAQAGYRKSLADPVYINQLERMYIPYFPYRGDRYRVFEVEGDSMTFYKDGTRQGIIHGMHVVGELVDKSDYHQIANYYVYVIVTETAITVKRLFRKSEKEWVVISDNKDFHPQFTLPVEKIKELWLVKRKLDWDMAPPEMIDIVV